MAASAEAPSAPMSLRPILRGMGVGHTVREGRCVSAGTDTKANTRQLVREVGGLLERLQRRVALETLCDRGSSFRAELVVL